MRSAIYYVAALGVAAFVPVSAQTTAAPPQGRCALDVASDRSVTMKLPNGQRNFFLGGSVVVRCPKQSIVLKSDSLEYYAGEARLYFVGHVDYSEPRLKLKSEFLTYFQREERILAYLNVDARLPSGSTQR